MPVADKKRRAVGRWLLLGVIMIIIQTLLGGITRLTGSGLSITEWKPIMGAIPPMNAAAWQTAFEKYKTIAQYKYLNPDFTLSDFKQIYFWEWLHREWARVGLALVFAVGFIYFLAKRYFDKDMAGSLIVLFVLGGLQGAIGWMMVRTGLNTEDLYVGHFALSIHFVSAMVLACYTLWFALKLLVPQNRIVQRTKVWNLTILALVILGVQLFFGAFMAGLKAAPVAATWPKINGEWWPSNLHTYGTRSFSGISELVSNPVGVQAVHRLLAYLLLVVILGWFLLARSFARTTGKSLISSSFKWPMLAVLLQVALGIFTVLNGAQPVANHFGLFEALALAHQLVAMLLLIALVVNLYAVRRERVVSKV